MNSLLCGPLTAVVGALSPYQVWLSNEEAGTQYLTRAGLVQCSLFSFSLMLTKLKQKASNQGANSKGLNCPLFGKFSGLRCFFRSTFMALYYQVLMAPFSSKDCPLTLVVMTGFGIVSSPHILVEVIVMSEMGKSSLDLWRERRVWISS